MKTILRGDEIANVGLTKVWTKVAWIDELVLCFKVVSDTYGHCVD